MEARGPVAVAEIGLTENEALSAALAALGINGAVVGMTMEARVLAEYRKQIRAKGRLVSAREVAESIGVNASTVTQVCSRMVLAGKMLRTVNGSTSRPAYVPSAEG